MEQKIFTVSGMTCQHCVAQVQSLLSAVAGVRAVMVELMPPRVRVEGDDINIAVLAAALAGTRFSINAPVTKSDA